MDRIGLVEAIATLREELTAGLEQAEDERLTFPIDGMQLDLQVGCTSDADSPSGLRFWVVELGAGTRVAHEQVQRVTVYLGAPGNGGA